MNRKRCRLWVVMLSVGILTMPTLHSVAAAPSDGGKAAAITQSSPAVSDQAAALVKPAAKDDGLPPGLVARWRGNGNAREAISGLDGTTYGVVSYVPGVIGSGFLFDGNSGVQVADAAPFQLGGSLTVTAWVKIDGARAGAAHQIVFRGDDRPGLDPFTLSVVASDNGSPVVRFHIENVGGAQEISAPVALGRFRHVAGSLDVATGMMRLYLDGKPVAEAKTALTPLAELDPGSHPGIGIGNTSNPHDFNQPFDGVINEVQIYNRGLTPAEIATLAKPPVGAGTPLDAQHWEAPNRAAAPGPLPRWWPRYARPKTVLIVTRPTTQEEYTTLLTLSGLVARAAQQGRTQEMIWVRQAQPNAYALWLAAMLRQTGATSEGPFTTGQLLRRFRNAGIVRGYLVYHSDDLPRDVHGGTPADTSVNVATSLCAPMEGVAVADTLEPDAQQLGLRRLFDARGISEAACFARYRDVFNREVVAMQDPKVPEVRDAAVAMQAFMLSQPGALYEQVLAWAKPDSPVLGWGIGDEWDLTSRATRQGLFQTDTDWCTNLPALSTEEIGKTYEATRLQPPHPRTLWDLTWEDNVHYTTFVMSDGDNVQWLMGDFTQSAEHSWWDSPFRGKVPMGWTCCYDNLAQLSPYTLEHLFQTATAQDDFILFGGGYYYPDLFGTARPEAKALSRRASEVGAYMRMGKIKLLMFNLQQWDSQAGLEAFSTYAQSNPDLLGIFAISYNPYTAGRGNMHWVTDGRGGETPVVSLRYAIWNHSGDPSQGDPVKVASFLNGAPHQGAPATMDYFSTVMIHCWSWFRAPHDGRPAEEVDQAQGGRPGTGRGASAAVWCADQLQPYVRVLMPGDFMWMLRLRLHPQPTLQAQLDRLGQQLKAQQLQAQQRQVQQLKAQQQNAKEHPEQELLTQAAAEWKAAERCLASDDYAGCFAHGKRAHALLIQTITP